MILRAQQTLKGNFYDSRNCSIVVGKSQPVKPKSKEKGHNWSSKRELLKCLNTSYRYKVYIQIKGLSYFLP